jgi:hypothetical protein
MPLNCKEIQSDPAQKALAYLSTHLCELFLSSSFLRAHSFTTEALCSFEYLFLPQKKKKNSFVFLLVQVDLTLTKFNITKQQKGTNFKYQNAINWMKRNINFKLFKSFLLYVVVVRCIFFAKFICALKHTRYKSLSDVSNWFDFHVFPPHRCN